MTNEELAVKIKNGDTNSIPLLWEQTHKLMQRLCSKFYCLYEHQCKNAGVALDDLMQEGYFVMLNAISAFDAERQYKFTTYFRYHIQNSFNEMIGNRTAKGRMNALNNSISLDKPLTSDDGEFTLADTIESPQSQWAFDRIIDTIANNQKVNLILSELQKIGDLQLNTVKKRYLLGQTLKDIADDCGCTPERIRQIQNQAFIKLRRNREIRKMAEEYTSSQTDYYRHKGLESFHNSGYSVVEDAVERRERLRAEFRAKYNS